MRDPAGHVALSVGFLSIAQRPLEDSAMQRVLILWAMVAFPVKPVVLRQLKQGTCHDDLAETQWLVESVKIEPQLGEFDRDVEGIAVSNSIPAQSRSKSASC